MSEWIEFKTKEPNNSTIGTFRLYNIVGLGRTADNKAALLVEGGNDLIPFEVDDTYEEAFKKIQDAERADLAYERFTKEEYERLQALVKVEAEECVAEKAPTDVILPLLEKLNNILEEYK